MKTFSIEQLVMKTLRILKSKPMNWKNRWWKWPVDLVEDIRQWISVRKALKEPLTKKLLSEFKYELRVDRIGRIYTVINVPENLLNVEGPIDVTYPWMLEQLRELDTLLLKCRLNELVFPEVKPLDYAPAYLVILTPSTESLSIWKFFGWLLNVGMWSFIFILLDKIFYRFVDQHIIEALINLF